MSRNGATRSELQGPAGVPRCFSKLRQWATQVAHAEPRPGLGASAAKCARGESTKKGREQDRQKTMPTATTGKAPHLPGVGERKFSVSLKLSTALVTGLSADVQFLGWPEDGMEASSLSGISARSLSHRQYTRTLCCAQAAAHCGPCRSRAWTLSGFGLAGRDASTLPLISRDA